MRELQSNIIFKLAPPVCQKAIKIWTLRKDDGQNSRKKTLQHHLKSVGLKRRNQLIHYIWTPISSGFDKVPNI